MKGCLTIIIGLLFPRTLLLIIWVLTNNFDAFYTTIWPFLGWFFTPYATLVWMYGADNYSISGLTAVIWALALVFDIVLKPVKILAMAGPVK